MPAQSTATIPLYEFPNQGGGYKIGINVSLDGGANYRMYEFDTGGQGFWAAYNPSWWTNDPISNSLSVSNTYSSTIVYQAQVVPEPITFQGTIVGVPTPLTVNNGNVAAIENASKTANPNPFTNEIWQADISATPTPIPPLYGNFFGDFGMGLGTSNGMFAILPQLTGFSNGFIIDLGGYPTNTTPSAGGYVQTGSVQVGLTPQDIASFPYLISMQGQNTGTVFPNTNQPTYQERLGSGTVTVVSNGATPFSAPTGLVFDTGAPTTEIHTGSVITAAGLQPFLDNNGNLTPPAIFSLSSPGTTVPVPPGTLSPNWLLSIPVGNSSGLNLISTTTPDNNGTGYINTGLEPFFAGRVMYDLADGILGFAPACFASGTRIATPTGEASVDTLRVGDAVLTISGAARRIKWIGHRHVDCRRHTTPEAVRPVRIAAHAIAPSRPGRDLFLSPDHALFLEDVLIPVKYLINGSTVAQVPTNAVTYFHIELDQHDVVLAEGLAAETYLDTGDRASFANGASHIRLHPEFGPLSNQSCLKWEADGYAPLVVQGEAVERVRKNLRQRARRLGLDADANGLTTIVDQGGASAPALRSHA